MEYTLRRPYKMYQNMKDTIIIDWKILPKFQNFDSTNFIIRFKDRILSASVYLLDKMNKINFVECADAYIHAYFIYGILELIAHA